MCAYKTRELVLNVGLKVVKSERISMEDHVYNFTSPSSLTHSYKKYNVSCSDKSIPINLVTSLFTDLQWPFLRQVTHYTTLKKEIYFSTFVSSDKSSCSDDGLSYIYIYLSAVPAF